MTPKSIPLAGDNPRTAHRITSSRLAVLAGAYGLLMQVALLLHGLVGERWPPVAMLNGILHLLLMPALLLFPVCLLTRRWWAALLVAPALVVFGLTYGPMFWPHSPVLPAGETVTLLTYNLHAETKILTPMVEVIRAANADVVALQEMSGAAAEVFDAELADLYPYRALHPVSSPYHGRGLLSRYPIVADKVWPETFPIPTRLQRLELDINDTAVTLYNMHAPPSYPIWQGPYDARPRHQQITDLLALAAQDSGAVLLMGDFNTQVLHENYAHITAQYHDAYREVGWGFGFTNPDWTTDQGREGPAFTPLHNRIDYVFYNHWFQAITAQVWPTSGGSDHRPVLVELEIVMR